MFNELILSDILKKHQKLHKLTYFAYISYFSVQENISYGYTSAAKEFEGMGAGDVAAWVASKQAGHMSGMHGLAITDKDGTVQTVGLALGDEEMRVTGLDASSKETDVHSKETGSIETLYNDVKKSVNSDTQTRELMHTNGGNLKKAADATISSDAFKFHANPMNDISEAAVFIQQATGMDADTAGLVAGAVGLGGMSALATNKFTKEHVQLKDAQLAKLDPIKNADGDIAGYEKNGKRVADKEGFMLDGKSKRLESGKIGRAMRNAKNTVFDLAFGEPANQSSDKTKNGSTSNQNDNPTKKPDDVQHNDSSNKDGKGTTSSS